MDEDTPPGTTILNSISVIDRDTAGENIEVTCLNSINSINACDIFDVKTLNSSVNSFSGAIVLQKKLNYSIQDEYSFVLKATVRLLFLFNVI